MSEFCRRKTHEQRKRIAYEPFGLPLLESSKLYALWALLLV